VGFTDFVDRPVPWLDGSGPEADVVISTRARLSRNAAGGRFVGAAVADQLSALRHEIVDRLLACPAFAGGDVVEMDHCRPHERRYLVEVRLAGPDLARCFRERALVANRSIDLLAAVNDGDHIRLSACRSGFAPGQAVNAVLAAERDVEQLISFAFSEEFGYLTAGLSEVGTGLRVSALLHLPGLVLSGDIGKILSSLRQLGFRDGGIYGDGTKVKGALFQVANKATLGCSEQDIAADFEKHLAKVIHYERLARETLRERDEDSLQDLTGRSWGILGHAGRIGLGEAMERLSRLRLGSVMGLLPAIPLETLNYLPLRIQPAHLRLRAGSEPDPEFRRRIRADVIREAIPF